MGRYTLFVNLMMFLIIQAGCHEYKNNEIHRTGNMEFSLVEIATFGKDSSQIEGDSLQAYGDFFSHIADLAVSEDGKLYVLDGDLMRITVFNDSNEVENVITGEAGSGPGEFRLPRAMTIDPQGRILVYDYQLQRVTYFTPSAELDTTIHIPIRSNSIAADDTHIWLTNLAGSTHHLAYTYFGEDEPVYILPLSDEDLQHSPYGVASWVSRTSSGVIQVSIARPGIWFQREGDDFVRYGMELMPGAYAEDVQNMLLAPSQSRGILTLENDRVGIIWEKWDLRNYPVIESNWLDIFRMDGEHIGALELTDNRISNFTADPAGKFLYLALNIPFPRVVKYQIIQESDSE